MTLRPFLLAALCAITLPGCRSAYYSAWEKLGKDKRDLLRDNVVAVKEEQKEAETQFRDALQELRAAYGASGSELEKAYDRVKGEYDEARSDANEVHSRIEKLEGIASDLFEEWDKEIASMSDASLRSRSRTKLNDTRQRYRELDTSLKRTEQSMEPVLVRFHDQVLFLKHSLNAQALGTLKNESRQIEADVRALLDRMSASIAQSEAFLKTLEE